MLACEPTYVPPHRGAIAQLGERLDRTQEVVGSSPTSSIEYVLASVVLYPRVPPSQIDTPSGTARAHLHPADDPKGALVLGHGAGAGIDGPDLTAATKAARDEGFIVALIEQPYRVAGRRSPAPAKRLDEAWVTVIEHLRANQLSDLPLIAGGRSLGARVACRTVEQTGAQAVLCLAFPLLPPRRGDKPPQSRLPELEAVEVPVLVVQGESDRFGMPPEGPGRQVAKVRGDHGLKSDSDAIAAAVRAWLPTIQLGR
jgi:predicted alpha/beta-hydrolase family hydrolase